MCFFIELKSNILVLRPAPVFLEQIDCKCQNYIAENYLKFSCNHPYLRRLAQERTSWIERLKTYVRIPVEVAIADLFHFDAYIEGPPWGPRMSL